MIATRSKQHLEAFSDAYAAQHKNKKSAVKVLMEEASGDLKLALCAAFMGADDVSFLGFLFFFSGLFCLFLFVAVLIICVCSVLFAFDFSFLVVFVFLSVF